MREILFRGKRVDNGEWVYGNIVFTRSGRAFLLARQPGADERRMIMNELKSVEDEKLVRTKLHKSHFIAIESRSRLSGKYNLDSFGKTVFLSREVAERALEESEKQ